MLLTATQLGNDAYIKLGVLRQGQSASGDLLNLAFTVLNDLIDELLIDELAVFAIRADTYVLSGALSFTIGPVGADVTASRPARIEDCNYVFNTTNPKTKKALAILTAHEFSLIQVPNIPNVVCNAIYYDYGYQNPLGYGTIFLWPGPTPGDALELWTWQQLQSFADQSTAYGFPPGYSNLLKWGLAERLITSAQPYLKSGTALLDNVIAQSARARSVVEGYNQRDIMNMIDPAYITQARGGIWSYLDGIVGGQRGGL